MNHHDNIAVFEGNETVFINPLKTFGDKLSIPQTIAHYISPQQGNAPMRNECVAEAMKSFGMDVIPICGDELAEIEGVGELGLILEHQIDSESDQFDKLVEEIKLSLNKLGWSYDGWVGEDVEQAMVH